MSLKLYISLLLISVSTIGTSISGEEYLKLIRANYLSLKAISYSLDYTLYKGYTGKEVVEEYTSFFGKQKNSEYRIINGVELININKISLSINHNRKTITVSDYKAIKPMDFDLEKTLQFCEKIEVEIIKQGFIVSLILRDKTDIPFNKLTLRLDKKYWIKTIEMFYTSKINFSDSYFEKDLDYPRLSIAYKEIDKNWKDKEGLLELDKYLSVVGSKLKLSKKLENYTLLDIRK